MPPKSLAPHSCFKNKRHTTTHVPLGTNFTLLTSHDALTFFFVFPLVFFSNFFFFFFVVFFFRGTLVTVYIAHATKALWTG